MCGSNLEGLISKNLSLYVYIFVHFKELLELQIRKYIFIFQYRYTHVFIQNMLKYCYP